MRLERCDAYLDSETTSENIGKRVGAIVAWRYALVYHDML